MTIYLIVGLPGAGKTTRARELELQESALRLTPDEWHMAVFHADSPTQWRSTDRVDQRDRIEGKLVDVGLRAAQLGLDVVLDFGLWGRDERSALRAMAESVGTRAEVVYLPVEPEEQRRRIISRFEAEPGQFQMDDDELRRWRAQFQVPEEDELAGAEIPAVPVGYASWSEWAGERWPSLPGRTAG
jgi:predicted kinase